MGEIKSFRDLVVYQKAYQLVLEVYRATKRFPDDERFCLTQQARRAALSIVCNVAEGWGRGTRADYRRFVDIARGSTYELQTQLWIARDLGYIEHDHDIHPLIEEVDRLVNGLRRSL